MKIASHQGCYVGLTGFGPATSWRLWAGSPMFRLAPELADSLVVTGNRAVHLLRSYPVAGDWSRVFDVSST